MNTQGSSVSGHTEESKVSSLDGDCYHPFILLDQPVVVIPLFGQIDTHTSGDRNAFITEVIVPLWNG